MNNPASGPGYDARRTSLSLEVAELAVEAYQARMQFEEHPSVHGLEAQNTAGEHLEGAVVALLAYMDTLKKRGAG